MNVFVIIPNSPRDLNFFCTPVQNILAEIMTIYETDRFVVYLSTFMSQCAIFLLLLLCLDNDLVYFDHLYNTKVNV